MIVFFPNRSLLKPVIAPSRLIFISILNQVDTNQQWTDMFSVFSFLLYVDMRWNIYFLKELGLNFGLLELQVTALTTKTWLLRQRWMFCNSIGAIPYRVHLIRANTLIPLELWVAMDEAMTDKWGLSNKSIRMTSSAGWLSCIRQAFW